MRRYDDGEFIENEPKRRQIRDTYRDKFFAELGGDRLKDPFSFDPDPASQLTLVQGLIDKALAIHDDDKSALHRLLGSVATSALGVPGIGATQLNRPDFQLMNTLEISKWHFLASGDD
jgi:hypothetical protein